MTEDEADAAFSAFMQKVGMSICPTCSRVLDRGDVAWNNPCTDVGTDYTAATITCQACGTGIADWDSWWPGADDWPEFVERVLPDMTDEHGNRLVKRETRGVR